jgi:hypothetical protein
MRRILPDRGSSPSAASSPNFQELVDAPREGVTIYPVGHGNGAVVDSIGAIQENRGVQHAPLLFATRAAQRFKFLPVSRQQIQWLSLGDEWHKPFCHKNVSIGQS